MAQTVAAILSDAVPLMEHPDLAFLSQVEKDLVTLINTQSTPVCTHIYVRQFFRVFKLAATFNQACVLIP